MSRNSTESLVEELYEYSIRAVAYHAGLSPDIREKAQDDFINDRVNVVCATVAFGMGIDKSNVRWVIHFNMPACIENYYQKIGRAGRDGMKSDTLLFYSVGDILLLRRFAEESGQKDVSLQKLNRMRRYCEADICRRRILLSYFGEKDVFIFNNTKVIPARIYGNKEKTGARIEVFLLRELNEENRLWDVLVDPARKIRIGNKMYFGEDDSMVAEVIDNTTSRGRTLRFLYDGNHDEFKKALYALGETPLPKYIDRPVEPDDEDRYQNIFATEEGAVVAPAAGLHFSRELMKRLEIKDCQFAYLTLHSGLGNFREIDVEDLTKHKMDSEQMVVNGDVVNIVNTAKDSGRLICAVATSVMRAIETAVRTDGQLKEFEGWTNKFIFPPYDFSVASSMITNFHMPLSTLLMMTASFGGYDLIMDAYEVALKEKYSFGAYGDAMLIL